MSKYGLHGRLLAKEGHAEKLAEILIKASELVSTAKGCRLYMISRSEGEPNAVWVTEIWDSRADHANALKVEGVSTLISEAMPILAGKPAKGQELEILGGTGMIQSS